MSLPQDPFILLSWVNTQLRDKYSSLEALCEDEDAGMEELCSRLERVGYRYDPEQNRFI